MQSGKVASQREEEPLNPEAEESTLLEAVAMWLVKMNREDITHAAVYCEGRYNYCSYSL
jgi:hypothetical protein